MSSIRLSRLISNGMVVQRNKKVHVWGWTPDDQPVSASMNGKSASATPVKDGSEYRFDIYLDEMEAGGPYELTVSSASDKCIIEDVLCGDVYQLAGQSNIEFPMARVLESYPESNDGPFDGRIRTFKVTENGVFEGPVADVCTGSWVSASADTLPDFSALGYFFAEIMKKKYDVPIGLVNTTLGGATIECFMSREMLAGYPDDLKLADKYADRAFLDGVKKHNEEITPTWRGKCDSIDKGEEGNWKDPATSVDDWTDISIPSIFFKDVPDLKGFIGSVWFKRSFEVGDELAGKEASLWLGTLRDSDIVYVNGEECGRTEYQYPPRRYPIREGLLHKGTNDITIKLYIETGKGRITPGKILGVFTGDVKRSTDGFNESIEGAENFVDLTGAWKYKKGCEMPVIDDMDFVNWKPTALFNGMVNPCGNYPVKALIWYQGESNAGRAAMYPEQFRIMVEGYRKLWNDDIPFITVKLPEFDDVTYEPDGTDNIRKDWSNMQAAEDDCGKIPGVYVADGVGTGELNDLHPQRKKELAERVAAAAENII
ncbi:MAG: hypothetical protein ILP17_10010 [Lachnospiraceae bacterium]|nr:hypothetical protein [Lachnospiraceae bacterium]